MDNLTNLAAVRAAKRPVALLTAGPPLAGVQDKAAVEVTAAHNAIYDGHSPVRVGTALDLLATMPSLTHADLLALASNLIANVMLHQPPGARRQVMTGVASVAGGLLAGLLSDDAAGQPPKPPAA